MNIWTQSEEAENLKKRFARVNRAEFARNFDVPGGQAMIYQHISDRRPISLDAAIAYANGFKCSLKEISPRLAEEARKGGSLLDGPREKELDLFSTQAALDEKIKRLADAQILDEVLELVGAYKALSLEERAMILKSARLAAKRASNAVRTASMD